METSNTKVEKPASEEQPERLQVLIGELLQENQKLRFQVAALEQQAQNAERGLAGATKWAGMLF
jgi:hypothetical protein